MGTFGKTLAKAMVITGVSQAELSERSGIYQSYISRLLNNKLADPTYSKSVALIHALGMSLDEFSILQEETGKETFGATLKFILTERGIKCVELSQLSGLNEPYLSRLVNGRQKEPTFSKGCAICAALRISPEEFIRIQVGLGSAKESDE